jgi:hypothetical protein
MKRRVDVPAKLSAPASGLRGRSGLDRPADRWIRIAIGRYPRDPRAEECRLTTETAPRWRSVVHTVMAIAVLGALLSMAVLSSCAPDRKSSLYRWTLSGGDYRMRLTGGFGTECVVLEREHPRARYDSWPEQGKDCAWARVTGGDGWLGGGQQVPVGTEGHLLFGIVPAAATEVVVTMTGYGTRRIPTKPAGDGQNRVYADFVPGDGGAQIAGLTLRTATGEALHVY